MSSRKRKGSIEERFKLKNKKALTYHDEGGIVVKALGWTKDVYEHVSRYMDPEIVYIPDRSIHLEYHRGDGKINFTKLISYPNNKPYDCLLFCQIEAEHRNRIFVINLAATRPTEQARQERTLYANRALLIQSFTYFFQGHCENLKTTPPRIPKFMKDLFGVNPDDYHWGNLCSLPQMSKMRNKLLIERMKDIYPMFPPALKARCKLGIAGHRILSISRIFLQKRFINADDNKVLSWLGSDAIARGIPYLSLHPGHPNNPFIGKAKILLSKLGEAYANAGKEFDDLHSMDEALFIPEVVKSMKVDPSTIPEVMPTVEDLSPGFIQHYMLEEKEPSADNSEPS